MEKKEKILLWVIIGIAAAVLIASIILAFTTPSHLITLWAGLFIGFGSFVVWGKYDTLKKHAADEFNYFYNDAPAGKVPYMDVLGEGANPCEEDVEKMPADEKVPEDIKPEEKKAANPAPKKKRAAKKKK